MKIRNKMVKKESVRSLIGGYLSISQMFNECYNNIKKESKKDYTETDFYKELGSESLDFTRKHISDYIVFGRKETESSQLAEMFLDGIFFSENPVKKVKSYRIDQSLSLTINL
jgi:hypothetical protein